MSSEEQQHASVRALATSHRDLAAGDGGACDERQMAILRKAN